jgi:hypothetical protein
MAGSRSKQHMQWAAKGEGNNVVTTAAAMVLLAVSINIDAGSKRQQQQQLRFRGACQTHQTGAGMRC